jgi:virginiamycin A acetyltransferase
VFLSRAIYHPAFEVGDYTYASDFAPPQDWATRLATYLFASSAVLLKIGRFCQIAHGVRFLISSANHAMDGLTTFPFPIFSPAQMGSYQPDRRDTIIGHDVWLGYGAMVLPGAHIGNGAIIGACAVVRGTIPDYAIITGNPGTVLRYRFALSFCAARYRTAVSLGMVALACGSFRQRGNGAFVRRHFCAGAY